MKDFPGIGLNTEKYRSLQNFCVRIFHILLAKISYGKIIWFAILIVIYNTTIPKKFPVAVL